MDNYKIIFFGNFYGKQGHMNRMDKHQWKFYNYIKETSKYNIELHDETEDIRSLCDSKTILCVIAGILPRIVKKINCYKKIYNYEDVTCRCGYKCLGNSDSCKSKLSINYIKQFDYIMHRFDTYVIREQLKDYKLEKFPYYVNGNIFKDWNLEKKYDILFYGNTWRKFYPMRLRIYNILKKNTDKFNILFIENDSYDNNDENKKNNNENIVGEDLSKLINQSWLTVATKSIGNLLFLKYYEIAFSKSVVLGNYPDLEPKYLDGNMVYIDDNMSDSHIISVIEEALSDKNKLLEMANNSHEYFTTHFEYKNGIEHFDNIITKLIDH